MSVKRALKNRKRPGLPFLIAVTSRARMGDAFPRGVEWFLEFSRKATNLNALLQGLLGRACGYDKNSTVVMSADNIHLVEDYKRERGRLHLQDKPAQFHRRAIPTWRANEPTPRSP